MYATDETPECIGGAGKWGSEATILARRGKRWTNTSVYRYRLILNWRATILCTSTSSSNASSDWLLLHLSSATTTKPTRTRNSIRGPRSFAGIAQPADLMRKVEVHVRVTSIIYATCVVYGTLTRVLVSLKNTTSIVTERLIRLHLSRIRHQINHHSYTGSKPSFIGVSSSPDLQEWRVNRSHQQLKLSEVFEQWCWPTEELGVITHLNSPFTRESVRDRNGNWGSEATILARGGKRWTNTSVYRYRLILNRRATILCTSTSSSNASSDWLLLHLSLATTTNPTRTTNSIRGPCSFAGIAQPEGTGSVPIDEPLVDFTGDADLMKKVKVHVRVTSIIYATCVAYGALTRVLAFHSSADNLYIPLY
ncbi:hypothetical protein BD410DRAFT_806820 [Rickenella mellea]|uniref:Uncharacterized protein n=1 Tax=Rickenella mellea TaxID=50990 RepID=A0A4Y7PRT7_9AGAM|nr:hypothetical protein BD410DRAFT_806820 [Rickenella mellea]